MPLGALRFFLINLFQRLEMSYIEVIEIDGAVYGMSLESIRETPFMRGRWKEWEHLASFY